MTAILKNLSDVPPRNLIEDTLGVLSIFVIVVGGLFLPVLA